MKNYLLFCCFAVPVCALADPEGMNHIDTVGSDLVSTPANGRVQVFSDDLTRSRMVIDDFRADGTTIDSASMAYEFSNGPQIGHPNGWRISVWASLADATSTDGLFTANTLATTFVAFGGGDWAISPLSGAGSATQAFRIDFTNLNLNIGPGVRYIGIAPEQSSTTTPNWLILAHNAPSLLGNGTANDSFGVNPGGALGLGTSYSIGTNASYEVHLVPEPMSLLCCAAGLAGLLRRRYNRSAAKV